MKPSRLYWSVAGALALAVAVTMATTDDSELHVPGAAHVAGANNTVWRTDLELRSVTASPAQVRIDLLRRNRDNTNHPSAIVNLDPGSAHRFDDVMDLLFGVEGSATLRLVTLSGEIRATSRTYNDTPAGTFGQFIGASGPDDSLGFSQEATLIQLSSSADPGTGFRTNIGLVNLVGFPINMEIDLHLADTTLLGTIGTTLQPFDYRQIDGAFEDVTTDTVDDGYAMVRATTYGAEYLTYASVIDNRTGDPVYIPGLPVGSDPTQTPSPPSPTATPTATATPTPGPTDGVTVTTLDDQTYILATSSIRFRAGNSTLTSLVLCSFDGALKQVSSGNFSFIRGPTETVSWGNCCSSFGSRLEYETRAGVGGAAVERSTCTPATPFFAITGTEISSGETIEVEGDNLDLAVWP
jgi:hypothetical protein